MLQDSHGQAQDKKIGKGFHRLQLEDAELFLLTSFISLPEKNYQQHLQKNIFLECI